MNRTIIAISISKIQTYIYNAIKGENGAFETEDETLKKVCGSSTQISEKFKFCVKKIFGYGTEDEILIISGKAIFFSSLAERKIREKLKEIYKIYYYNYQGKVELRYTYFESESIPSKDNLEIIHKCTAFLKSTQCMNRVISDNRELLFNFPERNYREICLRQKEQCELDKEEKSGDSKSQFLNGLNGFVPKDGSKGESNQDKKTCRIAILKADIDKMGMVFENIKNYEDYKYISHILEEKISVSYFNKLHKENGEKFHNNKSIKILPFYIAGDDIFFAVSISNIFDAIEILQTMLKNINEGIQDKIQDKEKNSVELTMSVGIDITENDQPIRYYYERVEEQLKQAKQAGKSRQDIKMSIYFQNIKYFLYSEKADRYHRPNNWQNLIDNITFLNYARQDSDTLTSGYFYNLLKISEDEKLDNKAYLNSIFYYLLPSCSDLNRLKTEKYEGELVIKSILMRLLEDENRKKNGRPRYRIVSSDEEYKSASKEYKSASKDRKPSFKDHKADFKNLVRLFLLFSDEGYQAELDVYIDQKDRYQKKYDYLKKKNIIVQSLIFPVYTYLYNESLKGSLIRTIIELRGTVQNPGYHKIKIEKSLFFKIKQILQKSKRTENQKDDIHKIASMIENVNMKNEDEGSGEKETKFTRKEFDRKEFEKCAVDELNLEYVDSLMLFYEYKKLSGLKRKY